MKYATCVPLIGGLTVAAKQVVGHGPEALLSYEAFGNNELNAKAHFKDVPHVLLDTDEQLDEAVGKYKDLDFINAVCPCAGLSMLSKGSAEQKEKMNSWMFRSAEAVLGKFRPKVFWGENAPGLYTKTGEHVREKLREIGEKNGYSFTVYHTNTLFHGVPQDRKRSFYFFWRDSKAPYMAYYDRPRKALGEYLAGVTPGVHGHRQEDLDKARAYLLSDPFYKFLASRNPDDPLGPVRRKLVELDVNTFTLSRYLFLEEIVDEAIAWFDANGHPRAAREVTRVRDKLAAGGGIWDGTISIFNPDKDMLAVVHRKVDSIHPREDRIFTPRELMHLMALPEDFELVTGELNHICQNVPVCTGADMTREVVAFLNGERDISRSMFLMQSNFNQRVDYAEDARSPLFAY